MCSFVWELIFLMDMFHQNVLQVTFTRHYTTMMIKLLHNWELCLWSHPKRHNIQRWNFAHRHMSHLCNTWAASAADMVIIGKKNSHCTLKKHFGPCNIPLQAPGLSVVGWIVGANRPIYGNCTMRSATDGRAVDWAPYNYNIILSKNDVVWYLTRKLKIHLSLRLKPIKIHYNLASYG